MARRYVPIAALALLVAVAGCTAASDRPIVLPIEDAERARELKLQARPPVIQMTREEFAAASEKNANEASDDELRTLRETYGRLGFFPMSFDPRSTAREVSAFYGAVYSNAEKNITVVGSPTPSLLVHELTHALQDEAFDLTRLKQTSTSTDESLAKRGLIEGDAVLAADRYALWARGDDPASLVAEYITPAAALADSEKVLGDATVPLFFVALTSFAYSYGPVYVANLLHVQQGSWSYLAVNELFEGRGPLSTQEVIGAGGVVPPVVPTGLLSLPADAAAAYDVAMADRIGAYYTYLLLHPLLQSRLPPREGLLTGDLAPPAALQPLVSWRGDQLLLLRTKDKGASGIVWTSTWDDELAASQVEGYLVALHAGAAASLSEAHAYTAGDGEAFWLERRGNQICFAKNLTPAVMEHVAHVALSTKEERRMELVGVVATLPPISH